MMKAVKENDAVLLPDNRTGIVWRVDSINEMAVVILDGRGPNGGAVGPREYTFDQMSPLARMP